MNIMFSFDEFLPFFLFILMVPKLRIDVNISYCKPISNKIGFSVYKTKYANILDINSWEEKVTWKMNFKRKMKKTDYKRKMDF